MGGERVTNLALLACVGVDEEGFQEVLAVEVADSEKGATYTSLRAPSSGYRARVDPSEPADYIPPGGILGFEVAIAFPASARSDHHGLAPSANNLTH